MTKRKPATNSAPAKTKGIDLDQVLLDLDGLPAVRPMGNDAVPMTARYAMQSALVAGRGPGHPPLSKDESLLRWQLTMKLHGTDAVHFSAEEIVTIKDAVCAAYGPLIFGQVHDLIDPAPMATESPPHRA